MKSYRRALTAVLIIASLTALTGCATNKLLNETVLNGLIYDYNNEPVAGASVYLNNEKQCVSDIYGHFTIQGPYEEKKYTLKVTKPGYEDNSIEFQYLNMSQMVYIKLASLPQLLSQAESFAKQGDHKKARKMLERIATVEKNNYSALYLEALMDYQEKHYEKSISILESLLTRKKDAYVCLLLADNYQYGLKDNAKAKSYLKLFLETEYNQNIQERYESL